MIVEAVRNSKGLAFVIGVRDDGVRLLCELCRKLAKARLAILHEDILRIDDILRYGCRLGHCDCGAADLVEQLEAVRLKTGKRAVFRKDCHRTGHVVLELVSILPQLRNRLLVALHRARDHQITDCAAGRLQRAISTGHEKRRRFHNTYYAYSIRSRTHSISKCECQ